MPLCTTCAQPLPHLYTIYQYEKNIRLDQCPSCRQIADPYIEHAILSVVLDLVWLKRGVYRHLLFNRGAPPRRVEARARKKIDGAGDASASSASNGSPDRKASATAQEHSDEKARWGLIIRLGLLLVLVDAFIRWSKLGPQVRVAINGEYIWTTESAIAFTRVLLGCFVETIAFHAGITLSSFVVLTSLDWFAARRHRKGTPPPADSGVRQQLRYSHIPLCLLYSSLSKFVLLFLLSLWGYTPPTGAPVAKPDYEWTLHVSDPTLRVLWEALDDDKLDREWVVRNVLGGMAAGFGLRVVLDCHPVFTTIVILAGWGIKTAVANVVSRWVGVDENIGETWLAYSIP